jgi:hypothetical protein
MEIRYHTFPFLSDKGGPRQQHMRFAFTDPVVQAAVFLKGYSVNFSDGDHELGQLTVQLDTQIVNHAPDGPEVVVYATLGLRDSGSFDDKYAGSIDMCLLAETRRIRPPIVGPEVVEIEPVVEP